MFHQIEIEKQIMKTTIQSFSLIFVLTVLTVQLETFAQNYVGSNVCQGCHNTVNANLGYNIVTELFKSGHPYKLVPINGAPPVYPANTSPGVPNTPPGTSWSDFKYVIGGYGWKARFVKNDGRVFTSDSSSQYNIATGGWVPYEYGKTIKYDYSCFKCHTTGATASGSWNGVPSDSLGTFNEPGVKCEGCHGPGSLHISNPMGVTPPNTGDTLKFEVCGNCHQRGGRTNAVPVSGGYVQHHEQFNEMKASKHRDGNGAELVCKSCHEQHVPLHYPNAAGTGLSAIKTKCQDCHANHEIKLKDGSGNVIGTKSIDCTNCHMSKTGKSAIAVKIGNGYKGDISSHTWSIETRPYPKDSMWAGNLLKLENGISKTTLDFACLACHSTKDLNWASSYATGIHTNGLVTSVDDNIVLNDFSLSQNYPNPFNPSTTIVFNLKNSVHTTLKIYAIDGTEIETLIDNPMPAGEHRATLDAQHLPSGVYLYKLTAGNFVSTKKMILIR